MKFNIVNILNKLLKKWLVIVLAVIIGAGVGFVLNYYKAPKTEYVAQVYIDQAFEEKTPAPNVNYPNTVESLTTKLMDNSLIAINSVSYLGDICEENDVDVSKIELTSMIVVEKISSNVIQVSVKFGDEQLSKKICEDVVNGMPKHLNNVILHNIDEQTGDFIVGTPESNKITVTEFMQPTKKATPSGSILVSTAIYAIALGFVAILAIFVIDLIKNKVDNSSSVRCSLDVAVNDANSFSEALELCVANAFAKNAENKTFAVCCGQIENSEIENAYTTLSKNKKVLAVVVKEDAKNNLYKVSENLSVLELSNDVLQCVENVDKIKKSEKNNYDVNLIIIKDSLKQEQTALYCKIVDSTFISLKNNVDSLWGVHELVGKLNDNEIKIERIVCV